METPISFLSPLPISIDDNGNLWFTCFYGIGAPLPWRELWLHGSLDPDQ